MKTIITYFKKIDAITLTGLIIAAFIVLVLAFPLLVELISNPERGNLFW